MGNSKSNQQLQVTVPIDPKLWVTQGSTAYCDIIKNVDTGQYAELYTLPLDNKLTLAKQYQIYEYRRTQDLKLVSVINVHKEESELLCTGVQILKVRTQRIPYRLSDLQNLSISQGIYILREALVGFKSINQTDGAIKINSNMICFTPKGIVKVWLNENLQKNHPQEVGELRSSTQEVHLMKTQAGMVQQVLRQVEQRLQGGQFPKRLSQRLQKVPMKNFKETINILNSFVNDERIKIVDHVPLDSYRVKAQQTDTYDFRKKQNNFDADINDIINRKESNNNPVISNNQGFFDRNSNEDFKNPIVNVQHQTQPIEINMYNPQQIPMKRISSHQNQNTTVFSQIPLVIQTEKQIPSTIVVQPQQEKFYQQQIITSPIHNFRQTQYQSPFSQQQYTSITKTLPPLPKALSDSRAKSSQKLKMKNQINQIKITNPIVTSTVIQSQQPPLFFSNNQQKQLPKVVIQRRNSSSNLRKSQSVEKIQPVNNIVISRRDSNSQTQNIINLTKKDSNASNSGQPIGLVRRDSGTLINEINRKYSTTKTNNNFIPPQSHIIIPSHQQQISQYSTTTINSSSSNPINYGGNNINSTNANYISITPKNVQVPLISNRYISSSNMQSIPINLHTNTNIPVNNNPVKINFAYNSVKPQTAVNINNNSTPIGFSGYIPQNSYVIPQNTYHIPQSQNIRVLTKPVIINNLPPSTNIQTQNPVEYNVNNYFTSEDKLSGNKTFTGLAGKNTSFNGVTTGLNNNYLGSNNTTYGVQINDNYKPFHGFSQAENSESVILKNPTDNLGFKYSNV